MTNPQLSFPSSLLHKLIVSCQAEPGDLLDGADALRRMAMAVLRSASEITQEKLLALFAAKATEPQTEGNQILVRHLKCKESVDLAHAVSEAMSR